MTRQYIVHNVLSGMAASKGRTSLGDNGTSERPVMCDSFRSVERIHQLVHEDNQKAIKNIIIGLLHMSVKVILNGLN